MHRRCLPSAIGNYSKLIHLILIYNSLPQVALGGWTFNDNGTATQPVFSDMVSTQANRQKFIQNLFSFLREFAFDGVDFDWVKVTTLVDLVKADRKKGISRSS